ncbi:MAG TPA: RNA degradosome polyphosphate kinase [Petrotogaceae bacterium]|jgi:polyphosphate kinase|nr:RNA degradosome polyphosphate kinase [Petrotogaceae bacterium]HQF33363.1 RNA degradosome polyphosphate kinase [Petrotogaceae bacterium]HQH32904.1 RNA degradosome polyphosphate kinase [Petrotogaceae bacterium]HQI77901.1 RNA degradosome polyphosphate kinase [Petrotogaceae bacterium]
MQSSLFINRELSWLEFNDRVLVEAFDKTNPLFEKLKFLSITASNLDEFFMIRVSGVMEQMEDNLDSVDFSGMTAAQQMKMISQRTHELVKKQYNCLFRSIIPSLEKEGIIFLKMEQLDEEQKRFIYNYFKQNIFPVLTPMAVDQSRPFPLLLNKSLNLIVLLEPDNTAEDKELIAFVQVPSVLPRIIQLEDKKRNLFVYLEDIMEEYISDLFPGYVIKNVHTFRITRNSDLEIDEEEAKDFLIEIEKSIKRRKWGFPVRLEVEKDISGKLKHFLMKKLDLDDDDVYELSNPIDLTCWMKFVSLKGFEKLRYKPMQPVMQRDLAKNQNIFDVIKEKDILVYHPFHTFDHVVEFVDKAAQDPNVLAIKQTLYRVSGDSPIVKALIKAAENGKQVTVIVELRARFDEENNIQWAKKLERSGCHVVYGLVGLKTHCKVILIVRREEDGIRRYVHMGTGNYNDSTAKIYTDAGLFTCKETYGSDVSSLFNVLTGYSKAPQWKKINVAPVGLREGFIELIENEIKMVKQGKNGYMIAKVNAVVDEKIIEKLYEASCAGVKIDLIVRGICCLRPGLKGVSENIRVISIVGRLLEHSRIFYINNGDDPKVYMSSADWMPRNLDRRVEILFPVEQANLIEEVKKVLDIILSDTMKARIQKSDGTYSRIDKRGKEHIDSQSELFRYYERQYELSVQEEIYEDTVPFINRGAE